MITLSVDLRVRPGHVERFLTAVEENAKRSFEDEPGCLYFDVSRNVEDPLHYFLFEVYVDEDALEAHRAAPHFEKWDKAAELHLEPGGRNRVIGIRFFHHSGEGR